MLRNILLGAGVFATLLSILIFSGKITFGTPVQSAQGDVVMWGTLPEASMNTLTQAFNTQAKTYAVRYKYVPEDTFKQTLLEALANGSGPDMILTPYQTILAESDRLYPFTITEQNFKDTYVDGASVLYDSGAAVGLPLSVDPMVLFYNRTLFSKHGIVNPPVYWDEVATMAPVLNIKQGGGFVESAVSLGTPNTLYAKDILMTIVRQLGQVPVVKVPDQLGKMYFAIPVNDPVTKGSDVLPLATAARFFAQFGDPGQAAYSWNDKEGNATDVFVGEQLAMYVGYAGELDTLRTRNPRAEFGMAGLPQVRGYNTLSTGMRMYAVATLRTSKTLYTALTVEKDFASSGVAPAVAAITGAISPYKTSTQSLDPIVDRSRLVAHGWYDSYETESNTYIAAMISDIINYRYGVNDAANMFVGRLTDLYTKK